MWQRYYLVCDIFVRSEFIVALAIRAIPSSCPLPTTIRPKLWLRPQNHSLHHRRPLHQGLGNGIQLSFSLNSSSNLTCISKYTREQLLRNLEVIILFYFLSIISNSTRFLVNWWPWSSFVSKSTTFTTSISLRLTSPRHQAESRLGLRSRRCETFSNKLNCWSPLLSFKFILFSTTAVTSV